MRRAIATVCLSGLLTDKLPAIAAAGFDAVEIFENDLLQCSLKPAAVRQMCADLGLAIDLFQPFRDFDAASPAQLQRNLDRAERKFDLMQTLGTDLLLVCSNVQPDAPSDPAQLAEQFALLAERAGRRGLRLAHEALAWGTHVKLARQAWDVVRRVDHPALGMALDSFHTLVLKDDPASFAAIPGDKIFFVQLADAPWVPADVLTHSRHHRCFPGQGEMDVTGFMAQVLACGYTGPLSLEVFNDEFRAAPAHANAVDAMRSLRWLEEQIARRADAAPTAPRAANEVAARAAAWHLELLPPAPALAGWSFVEFAADRPTADRLATWLGALGFEAIGRHRSKDVALWALGETRIVINLEPESHARRHFERHGVSVCALALASTEAADSLARARALGCQWVPARAADDELPLPAVQTPDASLLYFCEAPAAGQRPAFEHDFLIDAEALARATRPAEGAQVDHLVRALPGGQLEPWLLFERAVLGLTPRRNTVLNDPYGVARSREIESDDGRIRTSLVVSERHPTAVTRTVSRYNGAGVQQIAIAVPDVLSLARSLRRAGAPLLPVTENYHDDLDARFGLDPAFSSALREAGVLYERDAQGGEYLHVYSAPFDDRFEIEFVERRGGYALYGSTNAPMRLAALGEWRRAQASAPDTPAD
ncbi:MAG: hypothetical protein RIQ53_2608 [Pseudomonadota bacterium]